MMNLKCVFDDLRDRVILYNIATSPDAFGEPYKWSSHEIGRLGSLFNCIPADDISSIQLEAVPSISDKVMKSMHIRKLSTLQSNKY
ncbi:hypothetical protein evm_013006 [Chilo suppressalis]|nr:hypothetical protein evm_013006 [Chilo suppressalis]